MLAMAPVKWQEMAETLVLDKVSSGVGGRGAGVDAKLGENVGLSFEIGWI